MYLHLFICSCAIWRYLLSLRSVESSFKLVIIHFWQNLKTITKSSYWRVLGTWIHVCKSTSLSHMFFYKQIRLSISSTTLDSFWIICKVYYSILNSLEVSCFVIFIIKHSIFPINSWLPTETSWTFIGFKLTSIVSILYEELHMLWNMNMDNDRSIILNVELKVVEIFNWVT